MAPDPVDGSEPRQGLRQGLGPCCGPARIQFPFGVAVAFASGLTRMTTEVEGVGLDRVTGVSLDLSQQLIRQADVKIAD